MTPLRLLGIVFGANLIVIGAVINHVVASQPKKLDLYSVSIQQPALDSPQVVAGFPERLVIKNANVDIALSDGVYDSATGAWTLSTDKAHYALMTPLPNNSAGNTFIYGHNRVGVFRELKNLKPGDTASILTKQGKTFNYTLSAIREVDPTDLSLFEYEGPAIVTIQTCSGTWYEKRQLFTFKFQSVE